MEKPDELDVLMAIDNLRRDLSGYHGQLKAYSDLKKHSERQRERIATLEEIHARDKAENAKLRELVADMWHEGMCECGSLGKCATCMYEYPTRMRELGVDE